MGQGGERFLTQSSELTQDCQTEIDIPHIWFPPTTTYEHNCSQEFQRGGGTQLDCIDLIEETIAVV